MSAPKVNFGPRDTVFFAEPPKINKSTPFFSTAYEFDVMKPMRREGGIIGGSIFMNNAGSLTFVPEEPVKDEPESWVADSIYIVGTPEYPLGYFLPFSASPEAHEQLSELLAKRAESMYNERNTFFEYTDFEFER